MTGRSSQSCGTLGGRWLARLLLLVLPGLVFAPSARPATPEERIATRVRAEAQGGGVVEALVVFEEQPDLGSLPRGVSREARAAEVHRRLRETASGSQQALLLWLEARGVEHQAFWIVNMVRVRGDLTLLEQIAARPEVARIVANPRVRMADPRREEASLSKGAPGAQWNIAKINADQVWQLGYTGQGIVVAAQDTGFRFDHSALEGQYRGWDVQGGVATHAYNWHDAIHSGGGSCGPDSPAPCDDGGHGTHVMGILAGDDGASNLTGIAPDSRWIGCRNMDEGNGTPATYAECFQWFLAPTDAQGQNPDPSRAPHVVNNSWICPSSEGCDAETLRGVVQAARAAGIVVVASAGNSGSGCGTVRWGPAIYDEAFTVGATSSTDTIAGFSSRGPVTADGSQRMKPDVSAPGVSVRSTVPPDGYATLSGTSMAGPHVAGVVALLLSARPDLAGRVDEIEYVIARSATPLVTAETCGEDVPGLSVPNNVYGWGRVDALAAITGDADADGTSNLDDCRPAEAAVWNTPGPATDLTLEGVASTHLTWSAPAEAGADELGYSVLRATTPYDFSAATCLPVGIDGSATDDTEPHGRFYYLVQVQNACGRTSGSASDLTPRATLDCP